MRRVSVARQLMAVVAGGVLLGGCAPLIENLDNFEKITGALAFTPDPRSGDQADQETVLTIIPFSLDEGNRDEIATLRGISQASGDGEFVSAMDVCAPPQRARKSSGNALLMDLFSPASVIVAVGQLVVERVFAEIQSRIEKIKERNQSSYFVRRAWSPAKPDGPSWKQVHCLVVRRELTQKGVDELLKSGMSREQIRTLRMVLVLQRRPFQSKDGLSGSIIAPIYARVENSLAETGIASASLKARVRLGVSTVIKALTSSASGDSRKSPLTEVANISFRTIVAPLGERAKTCNAWKSDSDALIFPVCDLGTGLFADPPPGAPLHVNIIVTETGSAVSEAEAALASLEAVKKASKTAVTDLLTKITAGL